MSSSLVSGASAQAPTADASHSIVSPMQALAHLQDLTSQLQHKLGGLVQKSGSLAKDDKDDATGLEAALESADSPLAQAKLLVTAAYTIHSLVFIFLRTQGSDPAGHAVRSELARVKAYFEKIRDAEALSSKDNSSRQDTAPYSAKAKKESRAAARKATSELQPESGTKGHSKRKRTR